MSRAERTRSASAAKLVPFAGFAAAAEAAVSQLSRQVPGWDLWLVTCVSGDRQLVIAAAGPWADQARPGAEFPWQASLCIRMIAGQGSALAGDLRESPAYLAAAIGPLAKVRAYLGVPLLLGDEELFGTLCAFAGAPRTEPGLTLPSVQLLGRMLSTVLAGERAAAERSAEAAAAYAVADRDRVTGMRNRRGFEQMVALEDGRCRRFATRCSVLVLKLPDSAAGTTLRSEPGRPDSATLGRYAEAIEAVLQPGDVVARVAPNEFAVLAVETDLLGVRALAVRLRRRLFLEQLPGSVGQAARRPGEDLAQTWNRARESTTTARRGRTSTRRSEPSSTNAATSMRKPRDTQ